MIKNNYIINGDIVNMDVKYKGEYFTCVFNKEDYEKISTLNTTWRVKFNNKANRITGVCCTKHEGNKDETIYLHRIITNCPDDKFIDHIDRNPLNNLRENLRVCTLEENSQNQSKKRHYKGKNTISVYKGVSKNYGRFQVDVVGERLLFNNEIAAANYYNIMAKKEYGDFAALNDVEPMTLEECEKYKVTLEKKKTSKYKGVSFNKYKQKWIAHIYDKEAKKSKIIGTFATEDLAYNAVVNYSN